MSLKKNVDIYNKDVENEKGYGYTQNTNLACRRVINAIIDYIQNFDSQICNIIDIGCGDGMYTNEIKIKFPDKCVAGLDPAVNAIELAKKKYPNILFFVGDAQDYIINDGEKPYNLAILNGVLHHTANPEQIIQIVSSYAERILIIEPNGNNFVRKILEKTSSYYIEHEEMSFRPKTVKRWCENSGYKLNKIRYIGFIPLFFPNNSISKIIWFFTPTLEKMPLITDYFSGVYMICGSKELN
jgi:2-polyprenyl-3-methyl-5-hydroxy-6-metoxy-1,4-benzoquinol methylase